MHAVTMEGTKILVVDDDTSVRRVVCAILERDGFRARGHESGFGLAMEVRRFQPAVLILDISMPGLRGDYALRALSESTPTGGEPARPQIILFSGLPVDDLVAMGIRLGVRVLHKPALPADIVQIVQECIQADADLRSTP